MPKDFVNSGGLTPRRQYLTPQIVEDRDCIVKYLLLKTSSKIFNDETFTLYVERLKKIKVCRFRVENVETHTMKETMPMRLICADSEKHISGFRNYSSHYIEGFYFYKNRNQKCRKELQHSD